MDSAHPPISLLSLPYEILLRIIEHEIHHTDLDALALCSKMIFFLVQPARKKHLLNKRRFTTISIGDLHLENGDDQPMVLNEEHLASALRDLLYNSVAAAEYCTTLKICALDEEGFWNEQNRDRNDREALSITEEFAPQLAALTEQEPFTRYDRWLISHLKSFYGFLYKVPLILLYNIKVLELTKTSSLFPIFCDDFTILRESHHHLEQVRLFGNINGSQEHCWADYEALSCFAQFPSITSIHGVHLSHPTGGFPLSRLKHVTELRFESSEIDVDFLEKLFGPIKGLKTYFYETNNRVHTDDVYGPWHTIWALQMNAWKTLESLTLIDPSNTNVVGGAEKSYPMSLHDFDVLKHVAVECSLFKNPFVEDGRRDWYRLVDVMPPTLETLELFRPASAEELSSIFKDLRELKDGLLPNLRKISVEGEDYLDPMMIDDCDELGIELTRINQPSKDPHLAR
ncbi:MAG: hypothetical protein Q9170_006429 [Blastenia crenularia]